MADLVAHVWVRQTLYGPGNPPPPELWDQLPDDAWDEPPTATPEEQSPTGSGSGEAEAEPPTGTQGTEGAPVEAGDGAPAPFPWLQP